MIFIRFINQPAKKVIGFQITHDKSFIFDILL